MNAHPAGVSSRSVPVLLLPACVGFYLAARLCITFLLFQRDPQIGAIVTFALNTALLVATMFYSFGSGPGRLEHALRTRPFLWVLAFLTVGCCSLAWSATVSMPIAFGYWSEMAAQVAMIVLLLRTGPPASIAASVMQGYAAGACLIAAIAWLSPTMQDLRPGNDDFFSPNAIAFTCAFALYQLQYLSRLQGERRGGSRFAAGFLAVTLLRTLSKTTIAAFVVAQGALLLRDKSTSRKTKATICLVTFGVIAVFWPLIERYYEVYSNAGNQAETLTGRLGIWAFVLQRALEQPWIGHGFHSFRNVIPPFGSFEAWHAHNELLQQFYACGVVGIVLLVGIYGSLYRYARRVAPREVKPILVSLLVFIVVRGLGDTENFDLSLPLWFIALISLTLAQPATEGSRQPAIESEREGAHGPALRPANPLPGCVS